MVQMLVVTAVAKYDSVNVMITKSNNSFQENEIVNKEVNIPLFQSELLKLYQATFNKYIIMIMY